MRHYIMNHDGYFLSCFDREYLTTNKDGGLFYETKIEAEALLKYYNLRCKFKVVSLPRVEGA